MKLNTKIHTFFYHLMYEIDQYLFGVINESKDNIYFKFVRRFFQFHLAVSRYGAEFARHLAESLILPFDARDYATAMKSYVQLFDEKQGQELRSRNMGKELGRHLRLFPPRLCYQGCPS